MKNNIPFFWVVLGVLALASVAHGYYQMGMISNTDQLYFVKEKINSMMGNPFQFHYEISFPAASQYVLIMKTPYDYHGVELPTKCGTPGPPTWNMTLYDGHQNCYNEMNTIKCSGMAEIWDSTYTDYMLLLVNCNEQGLQGVSFDLKDTKEPYVSSSGMTPIQALPVLVMSALLIYIF